MSAENIYPEFGRMLGRSAKERLLGQRGCVVWLYGISGSGKSTLANLLERHLHEQGKLTKLLDGDNVRTGLNSGLGFSDDDRRENIRRVGEVARLFVSAGVITICSFITPAKSLRSLARQIIGEDDFLEVYVKCSFEKCAERDVKGLYAKARDGGVKHFTGKDSAFEEPNEADLIIDTEAEPEAESLAKLIALVESRIVGGGDAGE
jgi:adenylylsulfate kinase